MSNSNEAQGLGIAIGLCLISSCGLLIFAEIAGIVTGVISPMSTFVRACALAGLLAAAALCIRFLQRRRFVAAVVVCGVYVAAYLLASRSVYLPLVWPAAYGALFALLLALRARRDQRMAA